MALSFICGYIPRCLFIEVSTARLAVLNSFAGVYSPLEGHGVGLKPEFRPPSEYYELARKPW